MKEAKFKVQDIVCLLSHPEIPFVVSKVEKDVYNEISLETCVGKRISKGSTGYESVEEQIAFVEERLV